MRRTLPALLALLLPACIVVVGNHGVDWEFESDDEGGSCCAEIDGARLLEHIRVLASDEFEGRAPATPGEEKTVEYLVRQLRDSGLEPGNPDGTFVQDVPLVGMTARASGSMRAAGKAIDLHFGEDAVGLTRRFVPSVDVADSEVVFVGYGVVAPEYGWDDVKGADLRGKTIVLLVNDPPVADPSDPAQLDPEVFQGRAMTYYGRWTYKYEFAARVGAAAVLVVHQTGPAGYPWAVVQGSWGRENFEIEAEDGNAGRAAVEGWITEAKARELFTACGKDFDELQRAATTREFHPVALGATANFRVENALRRVASRNVVAKVTGSDPARRDEVVVYSAHWDHLGKAEGEGDTISNGAVDNASGCAGLLEIARSFAATRSQRLVADDGGRRAVLVIDDEPPARTVVFLFVTAEEKGLLGSRWYASHPLYPVEKTLANINMDSLNLWGRTSDVICVGYGQSTLDEVLVRCAGEQGRSVVPDAQPEKGYYYRSDHFEFAKVGVPALYADGGVSMIGRPPGWGQAKADEYVANDYHKPSDEVKPDWDLSGAVVDMELLYRVGREIADGDTWPAWKPSSEFRAVREASLAGAR
jgi:Zn-dependent M28 family amino/carboxypeptidase